MAFTKQPSVNTYQTKEISLIDSFNSRSATTGKDSDYLNCFFESQKVGDKSARTKQITKRAGLQSYFAIPSSNVRGMYYWEDQSKIYVATDDDVSIYNSNTGALINTLSNIFTTSTGNVGFSEFLYDTNASTLVVTDGTTLGEINTSNAWTASADPDLPVPHLPQPIFLDGYIFLVKSGTADIYNSDLNNPLAYTAGNFISCEMFPDTVLNIAKLNNYLLAFGSASVEYFWDAAEPAGSPLRRNDTPVKLVGYLGGLAQSGNRIYFVGSTSTATPDVYMLEDFKIKPLANPTVRRYLESLTDVLNANIGNVTSFMGHDFYVMNVGTLTYVMDLQTELWYRWGYKGFNNFVMEQSVSVKSNTTYTSAVFMSGETSLYKFNPNIYQDGGVNFQVMVQTERQMFDSYNQKYMYQLTVDADRTTSDADLDITWSDDDYQTFTTSRTVNLNQEIPRIRQLGRFRRRAFRFSYTVNAPLRLYQVFAELNLGGT